jgi:ribonucleoside-diphosphate reductase alpha chain
MYVIKRDGIKESVQFDKITRRIHNLTKDIESIDPIIITQKICSRIYPGITTTELDILASDICMGMVTDNPEYSVVASRIVVSNHQKNTKENFLEVVKTLENNIDINGIKSPLVSDDLLRVATKYESQIQNMIDMERDYLLDFFGFKTLERSYLLKINTPNGKKIIERPQHLFMRVAIGIHGEDLENVEKTYNCLSLKEYTHATPTLFNAGGPRNQLASCFLSAIDDSIEGIFETYKDCGLISKWAGGIGVHISNIRSKGSYIRKTGGLSDGLIPLLKTFNSIARQFNQGGKRLGSFAMYLEPWHADIFDFLNAKRNQGAEDERARDLFYALWIPDLFMEKVQKNDDWYLMCPDKCPGLNECYGDDFVSLYNKYVSENKYNKKIKARDVWESIITSQIETGTPYMLYKDAANHKSNQKNIGTIKSSNLCVSGDTMILTKSGYYSIKTLVGKEINVWNGKTWSKTIPKKTGENQKLLTIKFSNGMLLKCTEYHKFYIETGKKPADKSIPKVIEAKNLEKNMKIIRYDLNIVDDNNDNLKYAYTHGLYCADGTKSTFEQKHRCSYKRQENKYFCGRHLNHNKDYEEDDDICCGNSYTDKPMLTLYGKKIKLLDYIDKISYGDYIDKEDKINISLPYDIDEKYVVPINKSIDSKIKWLEGYLDGDSCIIENNGIKNIQYTSTNLEFMQNILFLLQTLGITSQIKIGRNSGKTLLPDGKGSKKYYNTQTVYRSNIDSIGLDKLIKFGFNPKRINISGNRLPHHITNMFIKVEDIIDDNIFEDTYCFNEPLEHKGIFNGIITGQCAEIVEVSNKDETSVCNLASICLPSILETPNKNYDKWFNLIENDYKQITKYYFSNESRLKLFSSYDCTYCKLLKKLLKDLNINFDEIDNIQAEEYRQKAIEKGNKKELSKLSKPFETVPQLFSVLNDDIKYLGGYTDNWNVLKPRINYNKLKQLSYDLTINLNKIIDINYYPIEKTRVSNLRHRPIGIGVQGLADLFMLLKLPFDSDSSMIINKHIFETMYYGSMTASLDLAKIHGPYSTFNGSPLSEGKFQFDLWGINYDDLSGMWNWESLRTDVMKFGVMNSLLIALMPTASTSQIMKNNECFEPYTSNIYTRRTLAGEFTVVNQHLVNDLVSLDLWNEDTKDRIIYDRGSVQNLKDFPSFLKEIYKTVWEISQKNLIMMSAQRGPFVCQSQSLNLWFEKPDFNKLLNAHFTGWKLGLKTGSYYIRTKPALSSQRFGLDIEKEKKFEKEKSNQTTDEEGCLNCSA